MFSTQPFRIAPARLAWFYAEEYVRTMWWLFIGIPISGVLILLVIQWPIAKYIGMVCVLWPLTIPARAALVSRPLAKKLRHDTVADFREDGVYFQGEGGGSRLLWESVREAEVRKGFLILRTRRLSVAVVPVEAIPEGGVEFVKRKVGG